MTPVVSEVEPSAQRNITGSRREKNEAARRLLRQQLEDASEHDEQDWAEAKRVIEENSLSSRRRFGD